MQYGGLDGDPNADNGIGAAEGSIRAQSHRLQALHDSCVLCACTMLVRQVLCVRFLAAATILLSRMLTVLSWCGRFGRSTTLHIQNLKFLKEMGLKKPAFLPDFGKVVFLTLYHF